MDDFPKIEEYFEECIKILQNSTPKIEMVRFIDNIG